MYLSFYSKIRQFHSIPVLIYFLNFNLMHISFIIVKRFVWRWIIFEFWTGWIFTFILFFLYLYHYGVYITTLSPSFKQFVFRHFSTSSSLNWHWTIKSRICKESSHIIIQKEILKDINTLWKSIMSLA
jgi:hypothetical protein